MKEDIEMKLIMEIKEIERMMNYLYSLVQEKKITHDDYDKISAYPYRKQHELKNKLDEFKRTALKRGDKLIRKSDGKVFTYACENSFGYVHVEEMCVPVKLDDFEKEEE